MTVTWKKICEGEKRCAMEFRKPQIPPQSMSWNLPGKKTGLHKAKGTMLNWAKGNINLIYSISNTSNKRMILWRQIMVQ